MRGVAGEVGHESQELNQSPIVYIIESKKTIIDLKRLHNLIMEISSSCFTLIVKKYYPDETMIDWHSFLLVSTRILINCQILSGFVR